jgi:hypothetical protein
VNPPQSPLFRFFGTTISRVLVSETQIHHPISPYFRCESSRASGSPRAPINLSKYPRESSSPRRSLTSLHFDDNPHLRSTPNSLCRALGRVRRQFSHRTKSTVTTRIPTSPRITMSYPSDFSLLQLDTNRIGDRDDDRFMRTGMQVFTSND